jgi:iron complex outermembrane receptor protein
VSGGANVSGNTLSNMPDMTGTVGVQYSHQIRAAVSAYGRAELVSYGKFFYDDANTASQSAYSLANFRAGLRRSRVFAELWLRNAFDTHYIPVAFAYPGLAPSGFVGESGAPRTGGIRAGVTF